MKYTPIGISPEQAQFLETRKFQIDEIARIFRVPPHMDFTTRWCSELAAVESTKYRMLTQGKIYDIVYVNPMGYKRNSLKFNCKLEKR